MRPAMERNRGVLAVLVLLFAMTACKPGQSIPRPPSLNNLWDDYPNTELEIYGAQPDTAGQRVYAELKSQPELTAVLGRLPEPDSIKIIGRSWVRKNFELIFRRAEFGKRPYMVAVDRTKEGFLIQAPKPIDESGSPPPEAPGPQPTPVKGSGPRPTKTPSSPKGQPTGPQKIECPIAPKRDDCQAFCPGKWSWCN